MNCSIRRAIYCVIALSLFLSVIPLTSFGGSWNGWIYQPFMPTDFFDVEFITSTKGWVIGKYGTILHTEDGAGTWEAQESGTEENLLRIFFVNERLGVAAGNKGSIIRTENGGKTWVKQYDANAVLTSVFFLNEQEGWITGATPMGVVFHTKDSGKTWEKRLTSIARAIADIYFVNPRTGWILAGEDVYRTTDGGKKWEKSKLPLGKLPPRRMPSMPGGMFEDPVDEASLGPEWVGGGIAFANEKQGWAAVFQWIFRTVDGGKSWIRQFDTGDFEQQLEKISFRDAQSGCAVGWAIYCTENGGKTWQERLGAWPHADNMLSGISLMSRSDGWIVGGGGRIFKTTDNGRSWKFPSPGDECGVEVFFVNKKTGWRYDSRDFNRLCRTDDSGHTWQKQEVGMQVRNVFFVDNANGWAVGSIGELKDGVRTNSFSYNAKKVWAIIKHTSNGGKTWEIQYKKSTEYGYPGFWGVFFINSKEGWCVGVDGTILHTRDGKQWETQNGGDKKYAFTRIHFINSTEGWIAGARVTDHWTGVVLHTEDGGNHWQVQHRLRDAWFFDLHFFDNKSGWVMGRTEYGDVGVLLHTEDGGMKWSRKEFENIIHSSMGFLDKERGVIYSENGIILTTTDAGKTWNRRRTPIKKYPLHSSEMFEGDAGTGQ